MKLTVSKQRKRAKFAWFLRDGTALIERGAVSPDSKSEIETLAASIRAPVEDVRRTVYAVTDDDEAVLEFTPIVEPTNEPPRMSFFVRGIKQTVADAVRYESFDVALDAKTDAAEPVIFWDSTEKFAALDVDFHGVPGVDQNEFDRLAHVIRPRWSHAWRTHGNGVRAIYAEGGGLTGAEWAAVAAVSAKAIWPHATVEVKKMIRHPAYARGPQTCGPVRRQHQDTDVVSVRSLFEEREASAEQVEEYLADRGMVRGGRYPHDRCPINPGAHASRDPVAVGEKGIYCHRCHATHGRGFRSWGQLCGGEVDGLFSSCVRGFVHFAHACPLVETVVGISGTLANAVYAASLKVQHGPKDPRIPAAMYAGKRIIRVGNAWCTPNGEAYNSDRSALLSSLPATWFIGDDGEAKVSAARVEEFNQGHDLGEYGYFPIRRIWSCRIWSHHLPGSASDPVTAVFPTSAYVGAAAEELRPRYIEPHERDVDAAWATIEAVLPRLNRKAVLLLIAAKGVAERAHGMTPIIAFTGATGASKTGVPLAAAAICGDEVTQCTWYSNRERLWQGIVSAKDRGSFAAFDEILKQGAAEYFNGRDTLDFMLNVSQNSQAHTLYVGQTRLDNVPVMIWTDTNMPSEVVSDAQLARRTVHILLPQAVEWQSTLVSSGVGRIERLRLHSLELAHACNVILSHAIDFFFTEPRTFEQCAALLGIPTLLAKRNASAEREKLLELFRRVCDAPPLKGQDAKRWPEPGWKVVDLTSDTPLAVAWREVAEPDGKTSRICSSEDWSRVIGISSPVIIEIRLHGRTIALRFTSEGKVNGDILELEPRPEQTGIHRLGDSIGGGLETGGESSVSETPDDPFTLLGGSDWLGNVGLGPTRPRA